MCLRLLHRHQIVINDGGVAFTFKLSGFVFTFQDIITSSSLSVLRLFFHAGMGHMVPHGASTPGRDHEEPSDPCKHGNPYVKSLAIKIIALHIYYILMSVHNDI